MPQGGVDAAHAAGQHASSVVRRLEFDSPGALGPGAFQERDPWGDDSAGMSELQRFQTSTPPPPVPLNFLEESPQLPRLPSDWAGSFGEPVAGRGGALLLSGPADSQQIEPWAVRRQAAVPAPLQGSLSPLGSASSSCDVALTSGNASACASGGFHQLSAGGLLGAQLSCAEQEAEISRFLGSLCCAGPGDVFSATSARRSGACRGPSCRRRPLPRQRWRHRPAALLPPAGRQPRGRPPPRMRGWQAVRGLRRWSRHRLLSQQQQ